MHFVDCDIQGTSGLDDWSSNTYEYPEPDPAKIGISTAEELMKICVVGETEYPRIGDYELLNDIDCSGIDWEPIGGIAVPTNNFQGTFNGRYYTISNLTVNGGDSAYQGLFGYTSGATIENVIITDSTMTLSGGTDNNSEIGFLVGLCVNTIIRNCYASGTITTTFPQATTSPVNMGALIGRFSTNTGTIDRCGANITMVGTDRGYSRVGGLIGGISGTGLVITDCYVVGTMDATGTLLGLQWCGGFTGQSEFSGASITNCYSAMTISGTTIALVGGFLGRQVAGSTTYSDFFGTGQLM